MGHADKLADRIVTVGDARAALGATAEYLHRAYEMLPNVSQGTGVGGIRTALDLVVDTPNPRAELKEFLDQINGYAQRIYLEMGVVTDEAIGETRRAKVQLALRQAEDGLSRVDAEIAGQTSFVADWFSAAGSVIVGASVGVQRVVSTATQTVQRAVDAVGNVGMIAAVAIVGAVVLVIWVRQ